MTRSDKFPFGSGLINSRDILSYLMSSDSGSCSGVLERRVPMCRQGNLFLHSCINKIPKVIHCKTIAFVNLSLVFLDLFNAFAYQSQR